jgi:hypothetical protein
VRGKGVGLVTHFVKELLARDVPIYLGAKVDGLVVERGQVTGVRMADNALLSARKGVVLATGGYEWNKDLMRDFDLIPGLRPLSPPGSTGDGLIMGAEIGAAIRRSSEQFVRHVGLLSGAGRAGPRADPMHGWHQRDVQSTHSRGQQGREAVRRRVVFSERRSRVAQIRHTQARLREPALFLIFDQQFAANYSLAHRPVGAVPASVARADTISELAGKLGIDADGLERTVVRFNSFAATGVDEDFRRGALPWSLAKRSPEGRRNASLGTLERPPFYAIQLHPSLRSTSAGLLTNAHAQVLHQRRHPIPGLYASGAQRRAPNSAPVIGGPEPRFGGMT